MNRTIRNLTWGMILAGATCAIPTDTWSDPTSRASTPAQLKLGHFTTADGMYGFVLDRTGAKAKLKIDGENDIIELTMEEDRAHGELRGYTYVSPDNKKRLYITTGGSILYYRGHDEHRVSFDKDAPALGPATIKGAPVKEVSVLDKHIAELRPLAVRTKFPKFTAEDASNLTKVSEAFGLADAGMFVHFKAPGKDGSRGHMEVAPSNISGVGYGRNDFVTDETEDKRHGKLAKHGGVIRGYSSPETPQGNHIIVDRAASDSSALLDQTPGLLWEINSSSAVFVTFDGGRYHVDIPQREGIAMPFVSGAGPDSGWPKPVADSYVDLGMLSILAKLGAAPEATVEALEKIDGAWNACVAKGWKAATDKFDSGRPSNAQIKAEIRKLHTACNKHIDQFEATLLKFIDERTKARMAVFATAAARAKSVGATK